MGRLVALITIAFVLSLTAAVPARAETSLDPHMDVRDCNSPDLTLEEQMECARCVWRFESDSEVGGIEFGAPEALDEYCAVTAVCRYRPRALPGRCPRSVE